jgi:hypothetical protein
MKKQILLSLAIFVSVSFSAQLYSPNGAPSTLNTSTGNVGIGTSDPLSKLQVMGDISSTGAAPLNIAFNVHDQTDGIANYGMSYIGIYPIGGGAFGHGIGLSGYSGISFFTGINERMRIDGTGNIGIGTNNPTRKLSINGDIYAIGSSALSFQDDTRFIVTPSSVPTISSPVTMPHYGLMTPSATGGGELWMAGFKGVRIFTAGEPIPKFNIATNGNASLQGKFEAKEIKVTLTPTADFVFEKNYNLPKLEEVEKHIKEKKHLPEIASAKEMEKEGVNVGEFQIKLLQKIEELTLYTIEQNKRIKELESKINKK